MTHVSFAKNLDTGRVNVSSKNNFEQMKNLEEKFRLTQFKNRRNSHVNLVEKEHVKQLDSNSEFNITNVEKVIETHLVESSNVYAF
jgi:NADPH-dependent glutamate synthase beta subunit-like oxidoreductase